MPANYRLARGTSGEIWRSITIAHLQAHGEQLVEICSGDAAKEYLADHDFWLRSLLRRLLPDYLTDYYFRLGQLAGGQVMAEEANELLRGHPHDRF